MTTKLSVIGVLILGMSGALHAQGTIAFNNFTATPGRVYTNNFVTINLAPAGFHVELMYAPLGGTNFTSARIFLSTTGGGQFFDGTTVTLSGIPVGTGNGDSNSVQLFLRGWIGPYATFADAIAGGGEGSVGWTRVFLNPTGGAGTALPANLTGWLTDNHLVIGVPEPSTVSLMGVVAGGAWLFRRGRRRGVDHRAVVR